MGLRGSPTTACGYKNVYAAALDGNLDVDMIYAHTYIWVFG